MWSRLKMIDRNDYGIATLATVYGWGVGYLTALWLALPLWAQTTVQGLVTIVLGIGALTAQHFWRRYLNRNWPADGQSQDQAQQPAKAPRSARFRDFRARIAVGLRRLLGRKA